jgi:hypothetical protein
MRRIALTVAGAAALLSGDSLTNHARAMIFTSPASIQAVMDSLRIAEDVQYFYGGRNYCWYPYGWNGPGWYWCGYAYRRGFGWGGGEGFRGWRFGRGDGGRHIGRGDGRHIGRDGRGPGGPGGPGMGGGGRGGGT